MLLPISTGYECSVPLRSLGRTRRGWLLLKFGCFYISVILLVQLHQEHLQSLPTFHLHTGVTAAPYQYEQYERHVGAATAAQLTLLPKGTYRLL